MRFEAVVELGGKTATGIPVPEEVVTGLGSSRRPAVTVTVKGHTYRSTIAPMGGRFMIPLSAENRTASGVAAGDRVEVDVELDTQPRELAVPADLASALAGEPEAKAFFDGLSFSKKQRLVLPIEQAKAADTRQRRVDKALGTLRDRSI
jgi:hypothetical protein